MEVRMTMVSVLRIAAVGLAIWLGDAAEARACTCFGEWSLIGADATEHPSGAPLVFASSCSGSFEPWTVTVDGLPATLGPANVQGWVATAPIEPAPAIGAEVQVMLDCSGALDEPACTDGDSVILRARYTVGAADTTAPPPVTSVAFTLPDDEEGTECFSIEGKQMIDVSIEIGNRDPASWIEIRVLGDGEELERTTRPVPLGSTLGTVVHVDDGVAEEQEICVQATVYDASTNVATAVQHCVAPDADAERRGCACAAGQERGWVTPMLGVLAVLIRRRRSREARRG